MSRNSKGLPGHFVRHGKTGTKIYKVWGAMLDRCYSPKSDSYKTHGARGIRVCQRWHAFANFYEDMGDQPSGMSIDRIDNDGDYCKENCRWADKKTQARNTRFNRIIEYNGIRLTQAEWSERLGLADWTIYNRLRLGWSVKDALETKIRKLRKLKTPNAVTRIQLTA